MPIDTVALRPSAGPAIWAVGGGKGGVGKSVVAANIAVSLAHSNREVLLVDADLGGANLHTLLGVSTSGPGLVDFVRGRAPSLASVSVATRTPNLRLISGANASVDAANPRFDEKSRLMRHLQKLQAQHVVLDLGAGSSFNVVDLFLAARLGVLVLIPEPTSIENAYHFLKAAFFRRLHSVRPRAQVRELLERLRNERTVHGIRTPRDLIAAVSDLEPAIGAELVRAAAAFTAGVVVNRVERLDQRSLCRDIATACRDYFGVPVAALGTIDLDQTVVRSIEERCPAVERFPSSPFAISIERLTRRLLEVR